MEQETSEIAEAKAIPNVKIEQINTNGEVNNQYFVCCLCLLADLACNAMEFNHILN